MSGLVERALDVSLTLGQGNFGDIIPGAGSNNVATFTGLRVAAQISFAGAPGISSASIRVWGLTASVMNAFSSLGRPVTYSRINTVTLLAGDTSGTPKTQVYTGYIQDAYVSPEDSGQVSLDITSTPLVVSKMKPVPASSFPNGADVGTVMAGLANQMGLRFANNGVTTQLSAGSYFWGTAAAQAEQVRKNANIQMFNDGVMLSIWPIGGSPAGLMPLISANTGLVGYPTLSGYGAKIKTVFNPEISFGVPVNLQMADPAFVNANGVWYPMVLSHDLSSITPNGPWFTDLDCSRSGV